MPLSSSPSNSARSANIATERRAGKREDVAVAIGYAKQRENRQKAGRGKVTLEQVKAERRKKKA